MFDLDTIENDWKNNSFCLTDEEIKSIYDSENVTTVVYDEEIKRFKDSLPSNGITVEKRLFALMFNDKETLEKIAEIDSIRKRMYDTEFPERDYLSEASQKRVVEGCMDVVFAETRNWYNFFHGKVSMEILYYICLESLFESAKYCLHSAKPTFRLYVKESIRRNITKNIARMEHISYHNAYCLIENCECYLKDGEVSELSFDYDLPEQPEKPAKIYDRIKNQSYNVDYLRNISSDEFMNEYLRALDELPETERIVMGLLFDLDGNKGFTYNEISEHLGISISRVRRIKREVFKKLSTDERIIRFRY